MSLDFIEIDVNRYAPDNEIEASRQASYNRNLERLDSLFKRRIRAAALGIAAITGGVTTIEFVSPNTINTPLMRTLGALGLKHEVGPTNPYTVKYKDNLWDIADNVPGSSDTRQKLDDIVKINHLTSPVIVPGESLNIPEFDN